MQERTLDCLMLNNKEYIFLGDLTILGLVDLTSSKLIVSGKLTIRSNLNIISLKDSQISAYSIEASSIISAMSSDIYAHNDLRCESEIVSTGNIFVGRNSNIENVDCKNYYVKGDNSSGNIFSEDGIKIIGNNDSGAITATKVFIGGFCFMNCQPIKASHSLFILGKIESCSFIYVGKYFLNMD